MRRVLPVACALLLFSAGALGAQQRSLEEASKLEQEALKRARVLRIVGIPGPTASLAGTLKDLGAQVTAQEARIELAADALFEPGKDDLRRDASARLEKVAVVLREFPAAPLVQPHPLVPAFIECHGDGAGAESQALCDKRADAVKEWLVENAGIDPARFATRGRGGPKPDSTGAAPDSGRKGSRVEITVTRN
jgi:outer membrane protein OmpA-like peptidoglycan-associated protein